MQTKNTAEVKKSVTVLKVEISSDNMEDYNRKGGGGVCVCVLCVKGLLQFTSMFFPDLICYSEVHLMQLQELLVHQLIMPSLSLLLKKLWRHHQRQLH